MSRRDVPVRAQFGRFVLDAHRHELLADGVPVRIGSRALDVLIVLTTANGDLVTKDELMSRVWPAAVVEENTLQFQISALRKVLGPDRDFIKTISGRGYRFIADISTPADPSAALLAQRHDRLPSTNPASPISKFIGSEAMLAELADLVAAHQLAARSCGGTGRTRQGIEPRQRLLSEFTDRAWIAALWPLPVPELVLPTVATVLGLTEASPPPPEGVTATRRPKPLLFLLSIGNQTRPW